MLTTDALSILEDSQHHPCDGACFGEYCIDLLLGSTGICAGLMSRRQLEGGEDEALRLR